jgi:NAD(P)-dependent dehydrogenase (short-subunit alcohol dehydrogenase family)
MNGSGKLEGKRALVTGAGTGIGREIALEFARQGADVALHYSHESAGADSAASEIQSLGRRAIPLHADFHDLAAALGMVDAAIDFLGGADILVNNAGITFNRPFLKMRPEHLDTLLQVNFRTPYLLTQRVVESMLGSNGGAVCNLSSIHGLQGAPEHSAYAMELSYRGVRVNAIAPGWITVENYTNAIPGFNLEQAAKDASEKVPVARFGVPLDVAKMAAYLCSEDSGFITGQTFVVDGGTTALMSLMTDFRTESNMRFGANFVPEL